MPDLEQLTTWRQQVDKRLAAFDHARKQCREETKSLKQAQTDVEHSTEARGIAQTVARQVQEQAHRQIAGVVTESLEAVFDEPYEFKIVFEEKRGRTEAKLVFEREGLEVDPLSSAGGGVVDVAAFALRLSCLMLSRPPVRWLLVLDEPFRFVSAEYRPRVRRLLEVLSERLGVQILMVTHIKELVCGKVVEL